jgi:hypothetical protein
MVSVCRVDLCWSVTISSACLVQVWIGTACRVQVEPDLLCG